MSFSSPSCLPFLYSSAVTAVASCTDRQWEERATKGTHGNLLGLVKTTTGLWAWEDDAFARGLHNGEYALNGTSHYGCCLAGPTQLT